MSESSQNCLEMLAVSQLHKHIVCLMDAFQKYALVMAVENKEVGTVAKAIFSEWFCKFSIPMQIHMYGGKEFVSKFTILNDSSPSSVQ